MFRRTTFVCVLATALSAGCLVIDEPEVASTSQEGIFGQGIFGQGIFGQGIFGQGIFGQGTSVIGGDGFDGTLDGDAFRATMRAQSGLAMTDVTINGSQLQGKVRGLTYGGRLLQGATWTSNGLRFRIARVRNAGRYYSTTMAGNTNASNADAWEYELEWKLAGRPRFEELRDWEPVCSVGPDGKRFATFVTGSWDPSRQHRADDNITIGCSAGTIHKCSFRWGYKPWKWARPGGLAYKRGRSLAPLHRACVFAASAVLCESGRAHTDEGTLVDMTDRYGFNLPADQAALNQHDSSRNIGDFVSESWYDQNGVVAVNYERYKVYFQSTYPSGDSVEIFETDEDGLYQHACTRQRSTGGDPAGWLVKIRSDRSLWPDIDFELPHDGGIIDEEGPMGPTGGDGLGR